VRVTRALSLVSVALVAATPAVASCDLSPASNQSKQDIVIAADLELSGAMAELGTAYDRALRLKIDQLNAAGGVDGRRIQYRPKDNRSDKTLSLANITDFTSDPSVTAMVTGACSDCVPAAAQTINDKRVLTVSLSPASDVTNPVTPYIFKIGPNPADNASAIAAELGRSSPKRVARVGLLTTDDQYGREGRRVMENELDAGSGITITATGQFRPTDTDVTQPVRDVLDSEPDALVVWAFADQAQRVAVSARAAGFNAPLFFDAAAAGDLFLLGSSRGAAGNSTLIFPQTMVIDEVIATTPAKAARKQWFRDYTARYGTYYGPASFAADAVQLVVNAIGQTGGTDPAAVRNAVETTQMDGLSGPIRMTPANHSGLMPQSLVALVASSGRWRLKV
jgi:branched-chain amino acid transport system substrate-binding protein